MVQSESFPSLQSLMSLQERFEDLQVVGYRSGLICRALYLHVVSCDIYDDPQTALRLEKEEHLLLWMENKEENLWIDRYDARLLLEDRNLFAK